MKDTPFKVNKKEKELTYKIMENFINKKCKNPDDAWVFSYKNYIHVTESDQDKLYKFFPEDSEIRQIDKDEAPSDIWDTSIKESPYYNSLTIATKRPAGQTWSDIRELY